MSKQKQKTQFVYTTCSAGILSLQFTWTMNNLSSYCGLVDAKIRASDKDLPVLDIFVLIFFVELVFAFPFTTISNDSIAKHTCFYSWSILLYTHKEETITFQYNSKYIVEKCGNIKEICMFKTGGKKMWNHLGGKFRRSSHLEKFAISGILNNV